MNSQLPTIFESGPYQQLVNRILSLTPEHQGQWGKMDVSQMMAHCKIGLAHLLETHPVKQTFMGKLISWMLIDGYLNDKPMRRETPTAPDMKITDHKVFEDEKAKLLFTLKQVHEHGVDAVDGRVSAFWGKLSGYKWGRIQYKHLDHHLTQFGA